MRLASGPIVVPLTLVLSLALVPAALAQDEDEGPASLTVCNHGTRAVAVAYGTNDLNLAAPKLEVFGWQNVKPGACAAVYDSQSTALFPLPAHVAFVFLGPQGQIVPAHVATIPDIGAWTHSSTFMALRFAEGSGPALSRSSKQLCLNWGPLDYMIPFNSTPNCAGLRPPGIQGALAPVTAQMFFHPSAYRCWRTVGVEHCGGGRYFLDVAPKAGDLELHATHSDNHPAESVAEQRTPEQNARDLAEGIKMMTDFANAVVKGAPPAAPKREEPHEFAQQRVQWWQSPIKPAASYQASWIGQVVAVRATVTSIGDKAMDAAIVLKDTPRNTLTVCPLYPNRLRQLVGQDLNALAGRTIEVTGLVEHYEPCGPGATIRIIEQEQFRLIGAR